MRMGKDNNGREYAKVGELKHGDRVQVDDCFTCLTSWSIHDVQKDAGGLYITCADEGLRHGLDGQLDVTETYYVGVYKI